MIRPAPALAALAAMLAGSFVTGYVTVSGTAHPNPIRLEDGVPVGVLDSPGGAVSAAENYLAAEDGALLSPDQLRAVVKADWAPRAQPVELAQPFPVASLRSTPQQLGDGRLTGAVAATKLLSFDGRSAQVAVWHELTTWSSSVLPTQHWLLDSVTLAWQDGRWLVTSRSSAPDGSTPVPAWTSGGPADRTSEAFDSRLAGMTAPYYGALP